jgi:hypothetical protein
MIIKTENTEKNAVSEGKKLLKQAINEITKQLLDREACRVSDTPTDIPMAPHVRIKNFRSLVLREEHDGWYGDIYLKKVPQGFPTIIGTSLTKPHADKRGAYRDACDMILDIYQAEQSGCPPRLNSKDGPEIGQPFMIGSQMFCTGY